MHKFQEIAGLKSCFEDGIEHGAYQRAKVDVEEQEDGGKIDRTMKKKINTQILYCTNSISRRMSAQVCSHPKLHRNKASKQPPVSESEGLQTVFVTDIKTQLACCESGSNEMAGIEKNQTFRLLNTIVVLLQHQSSREQQQAKL